MFRSLVRWRELEDFARLLFPSAVESVEFTGENAQVEFRGVQFTLSRFTDPNLKDHIQIWGPPAIQRHPVT